MPHQTTRIIRATLITFHETAQARIPRLPLTTTWRRVSHLTQPLKLLTIVTGRQEGTVYVLIKRACKKLGISRQVDLVRRVLPLADMSALRC